MVHRVTIAAACLLLVACQKDGDETAGGNGAAAGTSAPAKSAEQGKQSIADGLAANGEHGRFVNALRAAGLESTLSGAQPYTIFAPTDAAFAGLEGGGAALLAPENKARLVALLTGHIVPGAVTAEDLGKAIDRGKNKAQIATVGGGNLIFTRLGDGITVRGPDGKQGRISGTGTIQSNGVIHPIDTVLMPD
jgi:uncharacterized surface protein with fasciclin (FAS1) repeats